MNDSSTPRPDESAADRIETRLCEVERQLRERETSVLRAIKTLTSDYLEMRRGDRETIAPAVLGLVFAYIRPRLTVIALSIVGTVFAGLQFYLLRRRSIRPAA